jgi:protein-S-isoprenylcysteine O-methyltransferase Ste14
LQRPELGALLCEVHPQPLSRRSDARGSEREGAPDTTIVAIPRAMALVDYVIPAIWIAFWALWLLASFRVKATRARSGSSARIRVVMVLLVLALVRLQIFKGNRATIKDPWPQWIGFAVFLTGLALAVWARVYLGRNWGMPMSQKADPELVTTGPYRYVRHPIYSGIILAFIGTSVAISPYWLTAVVLLGAYFIYSATVEERNMEREFPVKYPAYKRSTKMLIPFIF